MAWFASYAHSLAALVLLLAGLAKRRDCSAFASLVSDYRVLPDHVARAFATVLPEVEIALACLLLVGVWRLWVASASTALFLTFAAGVAINLARGRRTLSCGCFGENEHAPISERHVVRNIALAGATVPSAFAGQASLSPASVEGLSTVAAAAITLVAGWLVATSLKAWRRASVDAQALQSER